MTDTALVHGVKSLVLHCLVPSILGQLMPQTWQYRQRLHFAKAWQNHDSVQECNDMCKSTTFVLLTAEEKTAKSTATRRLSDEDTHLSAAANSKGDHL